MNDRTIIYISSNKESPDFERKTRETLLKNCGGLPIVAVTQKPVDLGEASINVVVGDNGASGFNFCRQVLIACETAKTRFVVSAESDCIYPPEYFTFTPDRDDIPFRNSNIYVQKYQNDYVLKKESSTFAQVVNREFYRDRLRYLMEGQPEWNTDMKNFPKEIKKSLFNEFAYFSSPNPCVSFKTGNGMRKHSNSENHNPIYELPYWGSIKSLREHYE